MDIIWRAVGLSQDSERHSHPPLSSRSQGPHEASSSSANPPSLPDLASIASSTERGILILEEDARSIEHLQLQDAQSAIRKWANALQRKPRVDDSLASFKVQFLRSNALERTLDAVRKNEPLCRELLDPPLFSSPKTNDVSFLTELQQLLQLCMPKASSTLAEPLLRSVLSMPHEVTQAVLAVVRIFKDDWRELVHTQALRGFEHRLNSLEYELQKTPASKLSAKMRADAVALQGWKPPSYDLVVVLALLCESIQQINGLVQARTDEINRSLAVLGVGLPGGSQPGHAPEGSALSDDLTHGDVTDPLPPIGVCDIAMVAIGNKTKASLMSGLGLLGLPVEPLHYVPGRDFILCGHDIHVAMQLLEKHWVEKQHGEFFEVLKRIRNILPHQLPIGNVRDTCRAPPPALPCDETELAALRTSLLEERCALLEQVQRIDDQLKAVNAKLDHPPGRSSPSSRASTSTSGQPKSTGSTSTPTRDLGRKVRNSVSPAPIPADLTPLVVSAATAVDAESCRSRTRLATQLQQRRGQLLTALSEHLESERGRLAVSASVLSCDACTCSSNDPHGKGGPAAAGSIAALHEQLDSAMQDARRLCSRVEVVVGGNGQLRSPCSKPMPAVGQRCRAKWIDGKSYDAAVQKVPGDGTVVVNWLRPRPTGPSDSSPPGRKFVTVSEAGGDDSLHRIVGQEDVEVLHPQPNVPEDDGAHKFFGARGPADQICADCGNQDTTWASVSFGTYLCENCAQEHVQLGARFSFVRPLSFGWGWGPQELAYLQKGGNELFNAQLALNPSVRILHIAEKYKTRLAEHYRRNLDALCAGAPAPPPLPVDIADQPISGDFLSAVEVMAVVRETAQNFEDAIKKMMSAIPKEQFFGMHPSGQSRIAAYNKALQVHVC